MTDPTLIPTVEQLSALIGITPEKFIAIFRIEGPCLISFSGGRTSAFMLLCIIVAHGGVLPDNVHVCFANTGKEREETLRFVHECATRWGVRVRWLEWRSRLKSVPVAERFEEVGFNSASRDGEPLAAIIASKKTTPNAFRRFCTEHAKVQVLADFMEAQGYTSWTNVVGLRADEVRRVARQVDKNEAGEQVWHTVMPLFSSKVRASDVWDFWLGDNVDPKALTAPLPQGFDLGLYPYEGNCDDCFLKARAVLVHQERERPGTLQWWANQEAIVGGTFVTEYSYNDLIKEVDRSPLLIPLDWRNTEYDAECGVGGVDHRIRCGGRAA